MSSYIVSTPIGALKLAYHVDECERLLRKVHFNFLSFYLMDSTVHDNFVIFNEAAIRVLGDKRIRGRRRALLEKFTGKVAALRLTGKLKMEDELPWQD
jgi:hypothetical protein